MSKELKPARTYKEQIALLEQRGLIIDSYDDAEKWLRQINYYRLKGYSFHFQKANERFKGGTSFEQIVLLHEFDKNLRRVLMAALEDIEVYVRTQIAYGFAVSHADDVEAHYRAENFFNKQYFEEYITNLKEQMRKNCEAPFVHHHNAEYGGKMPIWCAVEILSFSAISKLYQNMWNKDKKCIAEEFGVPHDVLANWLHCFAVLRNTCAHYGRLYNTVQSPPIKLGLKTLRNFPTINDDSLFAYIICILRMLPNNNQKDQLRTNIFEIVQESLPDVELGLLGFPADWDMLLFDDRLLRVGPVTRRY